MNFWFYKSRIDFFRNVHHLIVWNHNLIIKGIDLFITILKCSFYADMVCLMAIILAFHFLAFMPELYSQIYSFPKWLLFYQTSHWIIKICIHPHRYNIYHITYWVLKLRYIIESTFVIEWQISNCLHCCAYPILSIIKQFIDFYILMTWTI